MKDITHEQLIRATYVVAKFKDPETAKLLNELAGRLDCALVAAPRCSGVFGHVRDCLQCCRGIPYSEAT